MSKFCTQCTLLIFFRNISVSIAVEKKLSTAANPCVEDPSYNFFKCFESYFYKQRGCQFPWNVYNDLDVPVCSNYTQVKNLLNDGDRSKGQNRGYFTYLERTIRTKMQCLPPCTTNKYAVKLERWQNWRPGRSLQIVLSDFSITYKTEYFACDATCLIGQLGGNLGFFLGTSVFLVLQMVTDYTVKLIDSIYKYYGKTHNILNDSMKVWIPHLSHNDTFLLMHIIRDVYYWFTPFLLIKMRYE